MTNYTKTTNFGAKDTLPAGDSQKIIRGTEFDTEFNNIATAVATKLEVDGSNNLAISGTFSATKLIPTGGIATGNGLYLPAANAVALSTNGVERVRVDSSGNVNITGLTASTNLALDASKNIISVTNTGTGNNVLATSPTLVTPNLGTPSALVVTNASGTASININGTVGATTPTTGAFTTVAASSTVTGTKLVPTGNVTAGNGMYLPAANTLALSTNGTERMRLDSSGNLGIGTDSPLYTLDVRNPTGSSALIRTTSSGNATVLIDSVAGGVAALDLQTAAGLNRIIGGSGGTSNLSFFTSSLERMRLNNNGYLGIGTASPQALLDVYFLTANTQSVSFLRGATDANFSIGSFVGDTGGTSGTIIGKVGLSYSSTRNSFIQFHRGGSGVGGFMSFTTNNDTERMRLDVNGQLLLGHTSGFTWGSGLGDAKAIEIGDGYSSGSIASDAPYGVFNVVHNARWNGTNWIYTAAAGVCRYSTDRGNGHHIFENAPVGTGGTAVTLTERFRIGSANTVVNAAFADYDFRVHSTSVTDMFLVEATNSNIKIGGSAERATTIGSRHLDIFNGTAPSGTLTNGISIYSSSGEAYVMDATGNATLISPHDNDTNEWIFRSKHTPTGKVLRIDVERMLRFVNDHFGLDAIKEFVEE